MKNLTLLLFFVLLLTSFSSPEVQRKLIRQNGYDIECYVVLEEINNFDNNKMYYWFRNSKVHNSMARAGGFVLHGEFKKFYRSQQLAENGFFEYGLKEGEWRSWYLNGKLKSYSEWWDGLKHGEYVEYDSLGNKVIEGRYKRNNKHGEWINYLNKDTLKYKEGKLRLKNLTV
ncbi:toxin-antitoxin system YwqK family antitoxin [Mesonia maritima]|uniref:toxin-antitoxin system YwqK family antitoxin n=1 Tax=Mesonia maritima TaxID=1793873 RepID=UPI00364415A8